MPIEVEVFSAPGCRRCGQARALLQRLVAELAPHGEITWRAVDVLEALDHAVALGVLATPAIAIDGELVFTGLPAPERLRAALAARLAARTDGAPSRP